MLCRNVTLNVNLILIQGFVQDTFFSTVPDMVIYSKTSSARHIITIYGRI